MPPERKNGYLEDQSGKQMGISFSNQRTMNKNYYNEEEEEEEQ